MDIDRVGRVSDDVLKFPLMDNVIGAKNHIAQHMARFANADLCGRLSDMRFAEPGNPVDQEFYERRNLPPQLELSASQVFRRRPVHTVDSKRIERGFVFSVSLEEKNAVAVQRKRDVFFAFRDLPEKA